MLHLHRWVRKEWVQLPGSFLSNVIFTTSVSINFFKKRKVKGQQVGRPSKHNPLIKHISAPSQSPTKITIKEEQLPVYPMTMYLWATYYKTASLKSRRFHGRLHTEGSVLCFAIRMVSSGLKHYPTAQPTGPEAGDSLSGDYFTGNPYGQQR